MAIGGHKGQPRTRGRRAAGGEGGYSNTNKTMYTPTLASDKAGTERMRRGSPAQAQERGVGDGGWGVRSFVGNLWRRHKKALWTSRCITSIRPNVVTQGHLSFFFFFVVYGTSFDFFFQPQKHVLFLSGNSHQRSECGDDDDETLCGDSYSLRRSQRYSVKT